MDKSAGNSNILSIQTKESTSKTTTIAPKVVGNKSKPTKTASKPKVEKLGWDTPLPPELAKEFQKWLNELKIFSEYSFERYVFGSANGKYASPDDKNSLKLHFFVYGGDRGYRVSVFLRFNDKSGFKMMRLFACSRVIGPNSSFSVPRRELCSMSLGIWKALALANDLEIPNDNIFCDTDSLIHMFWIKKNPEDLTVYAVNRVIKIQDYGIPISYVHSINNPSDNVSILKM